MLRRLSGKKQTMAQKTTTENSTGVDKTLVAMFLRMSPEERLQANDDTARTILELRNAYHKQKPDRGESERNP
jgi:hypothetical protein